jgi:hypothetical protein
MRRLSFVLMIALLMLRGWMGEAMATGMALAPLQPLPTATTIIATNAQDMGAQAHFHHETAESEVFHVAQAMHDCAGEPGSDDARHAQCDACAACQACHTVALTPLVASAHPVFSARALPNAPTAQFASADTARGQKPPIS